MNKAEINIEIPDNKVKEVKSSKFRRDAVMTYLIDNTKQHKDLFTADRILVKLYTDEVTKTTIHRQWIETGAGLAQMYYAFVKSYTEDGQRAQQGGEWVHQNFDKTTMSWK